MGRLQGKVAFITGANSGIGRAAALALAGEGADIALVARREGPLQEVAREVEAMGRRALVGALDVADDEAVDRFVAQVEAEFGRLDIAVLSAGLNTRQRHFVDASPAEWRRVIDVNLNGMFYCIRAVLPMMRRQGEGTIINISSGAGKRANLITGPAYSASKFGVDALTQSINLEERRYGVRACVIFPGEVDTPILDLRPVPVPAEERALMVQVEDMADVILLVACLPQRATVEEVVIRPTRVRDRRAEEEPKPAPPA
jgi:NAD(P)-dependent dehydrogenase (short-subunit alcohol dehydrogenase family)